MTEENVVTNGLLALYKFEDNLNNSVSGSGLPGPCTIATVPNTNVVYGNGKYDKALRGSGSNIITPEINIHPYNDDYTICFWIPRQLTTNANKRNTELGINHSDNVLNYPSIRPFQVSIQPKRTDASFISVAEYRFTIAAKYFQILVSDPSGDPDWILVAIRKSGNTIGIAINSNTFKENYSFQQSETGDSSNVNRMKLDLGFFTSLGRIHSTGGVNIDSLRIYNRAISNGELAMIRGYNPPSPPTMTTIATQNIERANSGTTRLDIPIAATDPDNLKVTFVDTPIGTGNNGDLVGASVKGNDNVSRQTWRWNIPHTQTPGTYGVKIVGTSAGGSPANETVEQTVTINVTAPVVTPPTLRPIGNQTVKPGETKMISLSANGLNGATPVFSKQGPTWVNVDNTDDELDLSPPESAADTTHNVTVYVAANGETDSETITVTVLPLPPNNPPVLAAISPTNSFTNDDVTIQLSATDPDGDDITYSVSGNDYAGSLDEDTGLFQHRFTSPGTYTITFTATDDRDGVSTQNATVVVVNRPSPPVLDAIGNKSRVGDGSISIVLKAKDPDDLPITFQSSASGTFSAITQENGTDKYVVTWTSGTFNLGTTRVTFTATATGGDPVGETDSETIVVTVTAAQASPPVLTSIGNKSRTGAGTIPAFTIRATDPNGLPITFDDGEAGGTFGTVMSTGNEYRVNYESASYDVGRHDVTITATATGGTPAGETASETITITVNAPEASPPTLDPIGNQIISHNINSKDIRLYASDDDNETLMFSVTGDAGANASIESTNMLRLQPASVTSDTNYTITVTVTATTGTPINETDSETITVTKLAPPPPPPTNDPPIFASISDVAIFEGESVRIQLSATDPEGENITYGKSVNYGNLTNGGLFTHTFSNAGNFVITFTASDGVNIVSRTASIRVSEAVTPDPTPPVLQSINNQSRIGQGKFTVRLTAKDQHSLPIGFRTSDNSGTFGNITRDANYNYSVDWTSPSYGVGTRNVTFIATARGGNPRNESDSQIVTFTVVANNPPVLSPIGNQDGEVGREIMIELSATDPDGHAITFSKNSGSIGVLDNGVFTWIPTEVETVSVEFTATDALGATDSETIIINVEAFVPSPPRIQFIPEIIRINENTDIEFTFTSTDPDDEEISFSIDDDRATLSEPVDVVIGDLIYRRVTFSWDSVPNGTHNITITAEAAGETSTRMFTISATSNQRPTLLINGDTTILSGNTFRLTLVGNDPGSGSSGVTYQIHSGFFPGMFLNESDGVFNWSPPDIPDGAPSETYTVEFTATDTHGLISEIRQIILTVRSRSDTPFLGEESSGDYDILSGQVIAYDDNNSDNIDDWINVISRDYGVTGRVVLDNGIIRVLIGKEVNFNQVISVYRIDDNNNNGKEIFTLMPLDGNNRKVNRVNSITFRNISINQVIVNVRYGDNEYTISLSRGMPYCNIASDVKKISIHRSTDSGVVKSGSNRYVENLVVPAFRGDYTVARPTGFGSTRYDFSKYQTFAGQFSDQASNRYARAYLTNIKRMFDNWIMWGIDKTTARTENYANVMCFVSAPTSIVRGVSELTGRGDYPSSNFIETIITFDRPFRVALIDIPSNARANEENNKVFINLTNEACQRVFERNFIRRRE